ncbi:alcohol dehydrogenase [Amycolatopsis sp. WAC 01376]|uniref:daptide-type RiPP biosynthesis dehydogenase n=1 Tax=Amycolatopsis sp. WAC 01376 TaxID=2203195 RepID=UPI000F7A86F2|nr:daptide-type RiPP biosynthesis dehydogenase [Amycolatopsis sp. WAC 01376]RSM63047.1 alcohol dehydrogenase [Amycolatopsis sp. WAC 01376]
MILRRDAPTPVVAGPGALHIARRSLGKRTLVVVDAMIAFEGEAIRLDASDTGCGAVRGLAQRLGEFAPDAVLAIGGGSVLDVVKLASVVHADPAAADLIEAWGWRAGAITLPETRKPLIRRVFVPTTVGTGVEASAVACVRIGPDRRIVAGSALRPDLAVLDPELTATLPEHLLREGALEALLRVLGPVAGSARVGGLPDAEAATLAAELVAVGDRISAGDSGQDARLSVAMLSTATHTGWALAGRGRYSAKHWYLANELSCALGVRKMVATACLLPAVWARILEGDTRYGNTASLTEAWGRLGHEDPVTGLRNLLRRWRIEYELTAPADVIRKAAEAAVRSWGGRLPMLAGLAVADIEELFGEVLSCST